MFYLNFIITLMSVIKNKYSRHMQSNGYYSIHNAGDYSETNCGYAVSKTMTVVMKTDGSTRSPGFTAVYSSIGVDDQVHTPSKHLLA